MQNIKFTKDGKKVMVLGDLNDTQKIVQEIFVINNQEVPQGKNFVVTDLFDAPAESWNERRTREIKELFEKTQKEYDRRITELKNSLGKKEDALRMKLAYLQCVDKADNVGQHFNKILDLITGKIKWAVFTCAWNPTMKEVNDEFFLTENRDDNRHLRMISLFGRDSGRLDLKFGQYSDGSGSDKSVEFFEDQASAVKRLTELINAKEKVSEYDITESQKWGITIDQEKVNAFIEAKTAELQKNIDYRKNDYVAALAKLNEFKKP